eukprot:TRINITY_DN4594_c0_g1_i1.p1 TRINITY_DN4594_c0_g1~~TRINITY_DN4594_c0_g1_i1.p1  ORF type:complete len:290 (+),score=100.65 TRINITY_DN4594_c0_g1_i1:44-871(+)
MATNNNNDKVVLIVGASSGIGAEIAKEYSRKKMKLVLAARRVEKLEQVAKECEEKGANGTLCVETDATNEASCENMIKRTIETFGRLDILVYNAGQAMHCLFENITALQQVMHQIMNVNFNGAVYCAYHALPHLKLTRGQIVVVSSVAGQISPPYLTFYCAAKHALHGFFESLRNELSPTVHVTIVCPGYVSTEISDKYIIADGSSSPLQLNVDPSQQMSALQAAKLIVSAAQSRKNTYHLTSLGSIGTTIHSFFPSFIDSAMRSEMNKIANNNS